MTRCTHLVGNSPLQGKCCVGSCAVGCSLDVFEGFFQEGCSSSETFPPVNVPCELVASTVQEGSILRQAGL